ncbi:SGNH/GDSL hydrolase family protein [Desulfococcaceae bacterium HSG9]|nr:SGNH/GDSL hydrolase family protein [Desulfococcaceae bacterium HSG9]
MYKTDKELGFTPIPNSQGVLQIHSLGLGIPIRYDTNGFRIPINDNNLSSDLSPVVLTLGDSFTYGYATHANKTYPYWVGQYLEGTVYNAGMFSYGLSQMLILARRLVPVYRPNYLIVQYSPWLAARSLKPLAPVYCGRIPIPYFYYKKKEGMALYLPVFSTIVTELSIERYKNMPKGVADFISFLWNVGMPLFIYDDVNMTLYAFKKFFCFLPNPPTNSDYIIKNMPGVIKYTYDEIDRVAKKNRSKLVIVVLGDRHKPINIPYHLLPLDSIIVDAHNTLLNRLQVADKENYFRQYGHWRGSPPRLIDLHPNKDAHRIIAQEIVQNIKSIGKIQTERYY